MMFQVKLNKQEVATLEWLSARGYDGDFVKLSTLIEEDEESGDQIRQMDECDALDFKMSVDEDPHSFLACSACHSLNDKLYSILHEIV